MSQILLFIFKFESFRKIDIKLRAVENSELKIVANIYQF